MTIHTIKFSKPVSFTDHTGVSFVNITTGETATGITSDAVSPLDIIQYDVTWVNDPIAGDVVEWQYTDQIGDIWSSGVTDSWLSQQPEVSISPPDVVCIGGSSGELARLNQAITENASYMLAYDIKDYVSGSVKGRFGGGDYSSDRIGNGTYVEEILSSTIANFQLTGGLTGGVDHTYTITNVIVADKNLAGGDYTDADSGELMKSHVLKLVNCANANLVPAIITAGSGDPSIIFEDPMTAEPLNGNMAGTVVGFTEQGMEVDGNGGWTFDLTGFDLSLLATQGQMSYQISRADVGDFIGRATGGIGTDGFPPLETIYILSKGSDNSTTPPVWGRTVVSTSALVQERFREGDSLASVRLSNYIEQDRLTFTHSWDGASSSIFINGVLFETSPLSTALDLHNFIHIAHDRGRAVGGYQRGHFSNFVIATRPAHGQPNNLFSNIGLIGDSFIDQSTGLIGAEPAGYQNLASGVCSFHLNQSGFEASYTNVGVGGSTITITGTNDIADQVAGLLASNPTQIIMQGGTNDSNNNDGLAYNAVLFEADYKIILTDLLNGFTGNIHIGTATEILGGLGNPQKLLNIASANAIIKTLPAWANGQGFGNRVVVFDVYTEVGTADIMFSGTWDPSYDRWLDDLHLSTLGRGIYGRMWAETLLSKVVL